MKVLFSIGVHRLTAMISASITQASICACRLTRSCSGPSVRQTSQQLPSHAYPIATATLHRMLNGVSQSHQPPA